MFLGTLDPEVGRFINADVLMSTGQGVLGCNMFCYCLNNPVNMCDESGCWAVRSYSVMMTDSGNNETQSGYNTSFYIIGKEHTKNARPRTKNKHEKGQSRKNRDSRNEKGDKNRTKRNGKRNRPQNEFFEADASVAVTDIATSTGQAAVVIECVAIAGVPIVFALSSPMGIWRELIS